MSPKLPDGFFDSQSAHWKASRERRQIASARRRAASFDPKAREEVLRLAAKLRAEQPLTSHDRKDIERLADAGRSNDKPTRKLLQMADFIEGGEV